MHYPKHHPHLARLSWRAVALWASVAAALALAAGVLAGPALANQAKGDFAAFRQCQIKASYITYCVAMRATSGEVTLGSATVPINKTITLQGGTYVDPNTGQEKFIPAENGETLSKTPESVPGGLLEVVDPSGFSKTPHEAYEEDINNGITGVTATLELTDEPEFNLLNLVQEEDVGLALPVRIRLSNAFLGSSCFIGSKANPIKLQLTTGPTTPPSPNQPISGTAGTFDFENQGQRLILAGAELVDNAFSEPGAEGCGGIYAAQVDAGIDSALNLPSAAGHNTAKFSGDIEVAEVQAVIDSQ